MGDARVAQGVGRVTLRVEPYASSAFLAIPDPERVVRCPPLLRLEVDAKRGSVGEALSFRKVAVDVGLQGLGAHHEVVLPRTALAVHEGRHYDVQIRFQALSPNICCSKTILNGSSRTLGHTTAKYLLR